MKGPLGFGAHLLGLHLGADRSQVALKAEDHNRPYNGRKIPLSVTISCTHRCNLACAHCQSENSDTKDDISTERFLALIDEMAEAGTTRVGFTGGEPLMRKDFGRIVERCRERGLIVSVVSNGWLVKRNIDWLKGIALLFLSLDGGREAHDKIRGPGNYEKFIEAARAAQDAGIPVAALTTLCSMNYGCVPEMIDTVVSLKLHWMVGLIQSGFTQRTEQDITRNQIREMIEAISKTPNMRASGKYLRFAQGAEPPERCWAGIGYSIIAPNGMMYPCFPAEFDHAGYSGVAMKEGDSFSGPAEAESYRGVSILDKPFAQAFSELRLYRRTCGTCQLACHLESNYLYDFNPGSILNSFKLMSPVA